MMARRLAAFLEMSRVRVRRSSPVAAWTTRMSRSWTSMMTGSSVGSADADVEEAAPVTEVVETEMPWCWARCQAMADMMAEATATRPRTGRRSARNR